MDNNRDQTLNDMPTWSQSKTDYILPFEEKTAYKQRMYCIVLRHLSPIQKGIQSAHAIAEYLKDYFNNPVTAQWLLNDKTIVVLDCKSSTELKGLLSLLDKERIAYQKFAEEDLYGGVTALCFLADERTYDYSNYPEYEDYCRLKNMITTIPPTILSNGSVSQVVVDPPKSVSYDEYEEWIGRDNLIKRQIIRNRRTSQ